MLESWKPAPPSESKDTHRSVPLVDRIREPLKTARSFQAPGLYFQNQFLSHSWLPCHWSHQGHSPPSVVVCQPLATEKWSFLVWRGIWTEIAWHNHLFGSGEYTQTATQPLLCSQARAVARSCWTLIPHGGSKSSAHKHRQLHYFKPQLFFCIHSMCVLCYFECIFFLSLKIAEFYVRVIADMFVCKICLPRRHFVQNWKQKVLWIKKYFPSIISPITYDH